MPTITQSVMDNIVNYLVTNMFIESDRDRGEVVRNITPRKTVIDHFCGNSDDVGQLARMFPLFSADSIYELEPELTIEEGRYSVCLRLLKTANTDVYVYDEVLEYDGTGFNESDGYTLAFKHGLEKVVMHPRSPCISVHLAQGI